MDCDAFDAGDGSADFQNFRQRPLRISATMHADILADVIKDPFPISSAMNACTKQGNPLGFIYRVGLLKAVIGDYGFIPTKQECTAFMYHPAFIAAVSEIELSAAFKQCLSELDNRYFTHFVLKDRCRTFV